MGKPSVPDAPDMDALVQATMDAAQMSYDLGMQQLQWAQEQYAHDSAITDQITTATLDAMDFSLQQAQETQARYEEVYQPVEDQMIAQAELYATPEYKQQEMGRAAATTAQQIEESKQATTRGLQSYGVNPSAGKQLSTDTVANTLGGAATAAASNQAAEAVDAKSLALTSDVANMGMGYPATSTAELNASIAAGQGTSNATTQATQAATNSMLMPATYIQAGTSAMDVAGTTANQAYANEIAAYNAQVAASSGIGSALGTIAGIGAQFIPQPPTVIQTAHAGGPIQAQDGGAIPVAASPSRGANRDDVPIMAESGEFMIPKRAVEWFGQKFFHDQIAKADKQKAEVKQGQQAAVPAGTSASVSGPFPRTTQPTPAATPAGNMQQTAMRYPTGAGSPPVMGSRPPGMAAGGAVAHYLPPGVATTTAQRMRAPAPVRRPVAPRMSPTMRMPAPGPIPISPTASPMVRSIRGMAAGGPVAPEWVWDPNTSQWVHSSPGDVSAPIAPPVATAGALPVQAPIDTNLAYSGYDATPVPEVYGQVPRYPIPPSSVSATSPLSSGIVAAQGPVAQRVPGSIPGQNAQPPPQGNTFVRSGYQPGPMGAAPPPIAPGSVQPGWQPGNMAYASPPPGIFPYSQTPPPYGVGQYDYPASPNAPRGAPIPWQPTPNPLTDSEVALLRRAITGGTQGKTKGGGSGGSKGGSTARKPKPRPEKKRPIIVENPPYSMTAAEFARQGQAYQRGKPYTATPALPSARSK